MKAIHIFRLKERLQHISIMTGNLSIIIILIIMLTNE